MVDSERRQILLNEYGEVCKTHNAITDFRAKLLTALPIVSGTGLFLLLKEQNNPPTYEPRDHLLAIGVFGFLATLGLFLQELRGIIRCFEIVNLGRSLEQKLGLHQGQFSQEHEYYAHKWVRFYSPETAAWLIYPATLIAWAYVAALPLCWSWYVASLVLVISIVWCLLFIKFAYNEPKGVVSRHLSVSLPLVLFHKPRKARRRRQVRGQSC